MAAKRFKNLVGNTLQFLDHVIFTDAITSEAGVTPDDITARRLIECLGDPETIANIANIVSTQGKFALKVTDQPDPSIGFEGYGEVVGADGNNIDVWVGPTAVQPEPVTGGFTPNVISSSGNDAVGGAGVDEVTFNYLDTAGAEQVGTLAVTGQTQNVHATITDCMFVNELYASGLDGGLVAAGRIDIRNSTTVMNSIAVSGNWALSSMRQVPASKQLCINAWHCSSAVGAGGKQATIRLRSTSDRRGNAVAAGLYLFKATEILRDTTSGSLPFSPKIVVPPLSTVKVSCWTTGAVDVAGAWLGWLEDV